MIFESLWPLFFLAAVPVIIILYLLKPKGLDKLISSNLLWQSLLKNQQSRTFFEKFVHNILMYLQILIVALLVTALMAPFFLKEGKGGGRRVLLLDTSGSMQHVGSSGRTRLEEAIERACEDVKSMAGTRFSLVTADASGASLLAVDIADTDSLIRLLQSVESSDCGGALTEAQGLLDTLGGGEDGELPGLMVYTDGSGAEAFDQLHSAGEKELTVVGEAAANVADEYTVYAQREDGLWDAMTGLVNYSGESVSFDVALYDGDENLLAVRQMRLEPLESTVCLFQGVDWKGEELSSRISGITFSAGSRDSLAADNVSRAVKDKEGLIHGLLVGKGNLFLEKAYLAVTGESIAKAADGGLAQAGDYNVIIYDAGQKPGENPGNCLRFGDAYGEAQETLRNVALTVKAGELTPGLPEFTIGVNLAYSFELPEGAKSFLECGGKCVGYYRELDGRKEIVAGFDIRESDFPLLAEFPVFLAGAMTYLSDTSWLASHVFYAGETIQLQPWAEVDRSLFDACPRKAGVYQVGNEDYQESYVVRFQTATESDGQKEAASVTGAQDDMELRKVKQTLRKLFLLLAILLLAAEWVIYVRQMRYRGKFYAAVRGAVAFCALLALFGASVRLWSRQAATVFVVDLSDSNRGNLEEISKYLGRTIAGMPDRNAYGIVTFGREALVDQFLTREKYYKGLMTLPAGNATNFEQAVSGALGMIPNGGRIVLLTDGKQTAGDIRNMARALTAGGAEFLTLLYPSEETRDAYIENVEMPSYLHPGDEYSITVLVESNYDTDAELTLYRGSSRIQTSAVHLNAGANRFVLRQQAGSGDTVENLRVKVQAAGDTCEENDTFSAYSVLEAPPRTLVISGWHTDPSSFMSLLRSAGCDASVVSALNAPADMDAMLQYKCIILANTYIDDLPEGFLENLEAYVKDYGCGFVCCGGEESFALGGYRDSVLETVLPVDMELRGVDESPSMAMVMVIDHSGSMLGSADGAGVSNLDIAIRAASVAVDNLRDTDYVGVLTFDDKYSWQVELTEASDRKTVKDSIEKIKEGGGTTIKPALKEAYRALSASTASIRHVVLLTDGMGETNDYKDVISDYSKSGITLSTVAVGMDSDQRLLERLARNCGGRYYYSDRSVDIPKIFAQEVFLSGDSYIQNGEFPLAVSAGHELTAGLFAQGWPELLGYVSSTPKTASRTVIASAEKDDPILTVWQYGLGRTAAWNSDITGEWTGAFSGREDYVRLWKRIVDYTAGNAGMGEDSVNVATSGETAKVSYQTADYDGSTEILATVIKPDGSTEETKLHAVRPGRYEAELATEQAGLYHFNIRRTDGGEITNYMITAAAVQFSDEYKFDVSTASVAGFTERYGRMITPDENIWKPLKTGAGEKRSLENLLLGLAILLFLADVAMRRFQYVPKWVQAGLPDLRRAGNRKEDRVAEKGQEKKVTAEEKQERSEPEISAYTGPAEAPGAKSAGRRKRQGDTQKKKGEDSALDTSLLLKKKDDRKI